MKGASRGGFAGNRRRFSDQVSRGRYIRTSDCRDWRENLFSVFVGNLSYRVSKSALKDVFDLYGIVRDVFIGAHRSWRCHKGITFVLVRYRTLAEMQRVIREGNNRHIDGWNIRVKEASFGWEDTDHFGKMLKGLAGSNVYIGCNGQSKTASYKNHRSYRDVVLGTCMKTFCTEQEVLEPLLENSFKPSRNNPSSDYKEDLIFDSTLPQEEMEWLDRCAVGQIKNDAKVDSIREVFRGANIACLVSPMGEVTVALMFESKQDMFFIMKDAKELFDEWLEDLWPMDKTIVSRKIAVWVKLGDIPLNVWHPNFFIFLVNKWGTFIKFNEQTINKKRFDYAGVLILELVGVSEALNDFGGRVLENFQQLTPVVGEHGQANSKFTVNGLDLVNNSGLIDLRGILPSSKKGRKIGDLYNKESVIENKRRGQRKIRQEFTNIIKEDQKVSIDCSDFSISDEDIAYRNSIVRREAEAT
ncbi:hypothetical protein DITRI_Ditri19aG0045700 [Diplodiscus trichospermus]